MQDTIFKLIDDHKAGNKTLFSYITDHPDDLYKHYNGMTVYSYATSSSLEALQQVHEAYIAVQHTLFDSYELPYEVSSYNGYKPIHFAVEFNHVQQLEYLMNEVHVNLNSQDQSDNTPLHLACKFRRTHIMKMLVFSGEVNINAINFDLRTPLYICALGNEVEMSRLLLKKGASLNYKRGRYVFNIEQEVKRKGSEQMQILFTVHARQMKTKARSQARKKLKKKSIDKKKNEYDFVCKSLEDNSNMEFVRNLAKKLGLQNTLASKPDLCKKIAQSIINMKRLSLK